MRTNVELIQILLDSVKKNFSYFAIKPKTNSAGLCSAITFLMHKSLISYDEGNKLEKILDIYRPENTERRHYWWKPGRKYPRVKFLKKILNDPRLIKL